MTLPMLAVFGVLLITLVLFISGRWRFDLVAVSALLTLTVLGIVPGDAAFSGFGHAAVVTVAAVLVVSRGLLNSGVVSLLSEGLERVGDNPTLQVGALTAVVALCSGFMNNVGALALFLPVAIRLARASGRSPSLLLMPIAFGSLLGGLMTVIGTPPNIIIATFRGQVTGQPFGMFDFFPVGFGVTLVGVLFIAIVGWRLLPDRKALSAGDDLFAVEGYMTEVRIPEHSNLVGQTLGGLQREVEDDVAVLAMVRNGRRRPLPSMQETLQGDDILIIRASTEELAEFVEQFGLELVGEEHPGRDALKSEDVQLVEAVVNRGSQLEGRTARSLNLRQRYGVNLLAVARHGRPVAERLARVRLHVGDVILLQGSIEQLNEAVSTLGCLPLADRGLRLGTPRRVLLAVGLFGIAIALTALGLLQIQVAFSLAAAAMILTGLIGLREAYESIDWPVILLLGAMIPVGQAMETTGGAQLIADSLLSVSGTLGPITTLTVVLVGTMFLSDIVNNAAAALLMAPVAVKLAQGMAVSPDPFLMAITVGASAAFLTPVGHQSNTLVMGPGGYRFGDYWRMGLPLEIILVIVAIPLILFFWPL